MKASEFLRIGKYILFERDNSCEYSDLKIDRNIQFIKYISQPEYQQFGLDVTHLNSLLANGAVMFVYSEQNKHLGMMCGYRGACYIRGPGIPLQQDENTVYWFWIYTLPEARGKNVYKKLKEAFFTYFNDVSRFTALVSASNTLMLQEMRKIGFSAQKTYSYLKILDTSLIVEKCHNTQERHTYLEVGNRYNLFLI